ncbi:MAG: hypothetical protein ACFCD0_28030 [Gemmataceae bacterium]
MSADVLRKLQVLEEEYLDQPPAVQKADLQEINLLRSQLGMPLVDAHLNEMVGAVEESVEAEVQPEPEKLPDYTEAREIYKAYRKKIEELEVHRAYADEVADATGGPGQTPVRPLATMGTDGGPLLCDYCKRPIVLEGGQFHGVDADVAWKRNPSVSWRSWILGGMVVEIETNGTLRIYHGYPGQNDNQCCNAAIREDEKRRADFDASNRSKKKPMIRAFLDQEFPDKTREERFDLLNDILDTMYKYDPGLGINRPSRKG